MKNEFIPYEQALELKELGFDEPCFGRYDGRDENKGKIWYEIPNLGKGWIPVKDVLAPLYQQAINFLYICSNKQIDIELKGSDTHEERIRKIKQGCKDLWNLQNNKPK
jgi:hypothetical protein